MQRMPPSSIASARPARCLRPIATRFRRSRNRPRPLNAGGPALMDRVRKTRSLSSADRDQIQQIAQSRPSVDVEIYFDYNSAALTPQAEPQLNNLGKALTSQD